MKRFLVFAYVCVLVGCGGEPLTNVLSGPSSVSSPARMAVTSPVVIPVGPNSCPDGAAPRGLTVNSQGKQATFFWLPEANIEVYEFAVERFDSYEGASAEANQYRHVNQFMTTADGMQGALFYHNWRIEASESARYRVKARTKSTCDTFGPWSPWVTFEVDGDTERTEPPSPAPPAIPDVPPVVPPIPPIIGSSYSLGPNIQAFGMLAGVAITCTTSTVTGDVGVSPGSAITGFPGLCVLNGTQRSTPSSVAAQADLTAAYAGFLASPCIPIAANLNGVTLTPGTYCSAAAVANLTSTLTLSGAGEYVIRFPSTLITGSGSNIALINGAQCGGVNWVVESSATLAGALQGNVLAFSSITLNPGATLVGRALARNAAVTLTTATLTNAGCN